MSFDEKYPHARCRDEAPSHWPRDVKSISQDGLDLFGIDSKGRFYWDGEPVEMRNRLKLNRWQAGFGILAAVATAIAALASVLLAVLDLLRFLRP